MWEGRSFQAWVFCVETCPLAASSILFHWMFAVTERTSLSDILDKQRSINKCLFLLLLFPKCISRCEISLDIPFLFFSIVFVPMVENSSWSLTFEEVSWFSLICVCLYSCLSLKKKMQYYPPNSNQTSPAMQVLCKKGGRGWGKLCAFVQMVSAVRDGVGFRSVMWGYVTCASRNPFW